jgi:predicted membrane channel-forming protein YqfA (hemolysin III family)
VVLISFKKALKQIGLLAFLFFLIKGIVWLVLGYLVYVGIF